METVYDVFDKAARSTPDNAFLATVDLAAGTCTDVTFGETRKEAEAARKVYSDAGVGHGHRVAILVDTHPIFVFHFLALNSLGATVVPVNPDYRKPELTYLVEHSEVDLVVAKSSRVDDFEEVVAGMANGPQVVDIDRFPNGMSPLTRPAPKSGKPDGGTDCSILYTSGTTGQPKGCVLSNFCHINAGGWYAEMGGVLTMRRGGERFFNPTPFYHVNNLVVGLTCCMLTGNCIILPERFSPTRWWPEVKLSGATVVHYVGIIPSMLMKQPEAADDRAHDVRFGFGAGVEPELHGPFEQRFGFPLVEIWGMTEIPRVFGDNFEPRQIDTRAFGRPGHGYEAMVVDDNDNPVPAGEVGELIVRASGADPRRGFFSGYLKNEEATEEAWRGGWFHTGDTVKQSTDGMLYFVDRKKNIIWRSGENISAVEVEASILSHPAVEQVAVIPVKDELRVEEVMACVVLKAGNEPGDDLARHIFDWSNERIAYYKPPGWIVFVPSLPVTPSQRLQRTRIFNPSEDPRERAGAVDLRDRKKRRG